MQPTLPIIIRKSIIGLVGIIAGGVGLSAALTVGVLYMINTGQQDFAYLILVALIVVALGTVVQTYVYNLSRIIITSQQLDVVVWNSIVSQNNAVCEWNQVQDIDFRKSGIFGLLFDYGTLLVQTAGNERNLRITMVPQVEHWRDYMAHLADTAVQPVHEQ